MTFKKTGRTTTIGTIDSKDQEKKVETKSEDKTNKDKKKTTVNE